MMLETCLNWFRQQLRPRVSFLCSMKSLLRNSSISRAISFLSWQNSVRDEQESHPKVEQRKDINDECYISNIEWNGDILEHILDALAEVHFQGIPSVFDANSAFLNRPFIPKESRQALLSMSLVCRTWRFPSQRRLFRYIHILTGMGEESMVDSFPEIMQIHGEGSGSVAPLVHGISLTVPEQSLSDLEDPKFRNWLKEQNQLYSIYIESTYMDTILTSLFPEVGQNAITVFKITTLSLFGNPGMEINYANLQRLLSQSANLTTLCLKHCIWNTYPSTISMIDPPPFRLHTCSLISCKPLTTRMYSWILSNSKDSLRTLQIYSNDQEVIVPDAMDGIVDNLSEMFGPNLEQLLLFVRNSHAVLTALAIRLCRNAKELGFSFSFNHLDLDLWLSSLPPALEHLRIIITRFWVANKSMVAKGFRTIQEFISSNTNLNGTLPRLKKITLDVLLDYRDSQTQVSIDELRETCTKRGIDFQVLVEGERVDFQSWALNESYMSSLLAVGNVRNN